jgi:uncharacterized protein
MMEFERLVPQGKQVIQGYRSGGFTVSGARFEGAVLVVPDETLSWSPRSLAELEFASFAPLVARSGDLDLVILGTGERFALLPAELRAALSQAGLNVEPMATPSACRTFNVLIAESRRAAAALLPIA